MNISNFKENMKNLLDGLGYKLYLGSLENYNSNKEVNDKVVLIEGLKDVPLASKDCKSQINLVFWILNKQSKDVKVLDKEGYNITIEDNMRSDAVSIYNTLMTSDFIIPLDSIYNVRSNYYPIDNSLLVNDQSILHFNLKCEVYEI